MNLTRMATARWVTLMMGALLVGGCPGGGSESNPTTEQPDAGRTGSDSAAALASPDGPPASTPDLALPAYQARPDGSLRPTIEVGGTIRNDGGAAIDRPTTVGDAEADEDSIVCGEVDMVWRDGNGVESRRDPNCAFHVPSTSGFCYDFSDDTCDGYRCLLSKDLSSACSTRSSCLTTCEGTCVSIAAMRQRCRRLDGGAVGDGG